MRTSPISDLQSHWGRPSWPLHIFMTSSPYEWKFVLFCTTRFGVNSRSLLWLNYKNRYFCETPESLAITEINVWTCRKVGLCLCLEDQSGCALFFFSSRNKCTPTATTTPSFTTPRSFFKTIQDERFCCCVVARTPGSKYSS